MKSIILNTFSVQPENGISNIFTLLQGTPYTDERGFGFENIDLDEQLLFGTLIKRNATYIYDYNPVSKEMVKKQITLFSEISFQIDFEFKVLIVFGQAVYLTQLKSALRNTFEFSFTTGQTDLSPYNLYSTLVNKRVKFEIQSISIEKFVYQNGISGKLIGNVIDNVVATNLVNNYKVDVNKALFRITFINDDSFGLQASQNGAVKFFSPEDRFENHIHFFKETFFK